MKTTLHVVRPKRQTIARIRQAVRLFRSEYAPRHIRRANARNWLKAVDRLGEKWVYAVPYQRKGKA
jgi:uncharacterized protein involved in exopolysaccharide biosynthesis